MYVVSGWHRHKIRIGFQAIDDTRKKKEKGKKIRVCRFGVVKGSLIWERPTYFTMEGIVSICYRGWCIKFATHKWPLQLTKVHFMTISSRFLCQLL